MTGPSRSEHGMALSSTAAVSLVARREVSAKLRDKGFLLSTAFIIVAILASVLLPAVFGGDDDAFDVGIVGIVSSSALEPAIQAQATALGTDISLRSYEDAAAARAAVDDEEVDAALDGDQVIVVDTLEPVLDQVLNQAAASVAAEGRLAEAGIDAGEVAAAFDVPPLTVVPLEADAERNAQRQVIAFIGVIVLYSLLILIGQYVAMGVVEEKSSRVVELLLSTIKPWQLLAGKVIGLGLLGLAQLVLIGVTGLGSELYFDVLAVPGDAIGTLVQVVGWFLLGYGFYAAIFAAGAALVSRQEDLQSVLLPTIAVLVAAFFVAIQAVQAPDGSLAVITSFVPGLSPLVMPVRMAAGGVPWWHVVASVLLMIAAIVAMVRLGGRIYAGALLRSGGKVKIKEALAGSKG
ncbi:MAG: ABC transporter permease [Geodermatophilaceae bacterium]